MRVSSSDAVPWTEGGLAARLRVCGPRFEDANFDLVAGRGNEYCSAEIPGADR